jgi:hypothetical protein
VRKIWTAAALIFIALLPIGVQTALIARAGFVMGDFRAFYCAARVTARGADPYRTEPLRSCEISAGPRLFYQKNPNVAVPAPLPGYALAALMPLSLLPFAAAALVWVGLLLLAWAVCVATLVRFAVITWQSALAVFALSLGASSIPFGEVVPLALAAICLAAYFAWQGMWRSAAIAAAVAMIEPHLALPVCVALAVWAPATRVTLGISFAALASLSLFALGPATNLEYFASVLPAHALSEAARDTQYSLTSVLASAGVVDTTAVRAGSLWYLGMLVAGAVVAGSLAKKHRNPAFLVCVPPAFAVFGGTFVHVTQIVAALPATVLFLAYATAERRTLAIVALLLLAVPWTMATSPAVGLAPAFPIAFLAWRYTNGSVRAAMLAAVIAGILLVGLDHAYVLVAAQHLQPYVGSSIDPRLAEATWSEFARKNSTNSIAAWIARIPTWTGLIVLLTVLSSEVLRVTRLEPMRYMTSEAP